MIRRLMTAALLASVAVLPFAQAVSAARPDILRLPMVEPVDGTCGGGLTFSGVLRGNLIVIDFGNRVIAKVRWQGTITGSNGVKLRVHHSWTETQNPDGTLVLRGIPFGVKVAKSSLSVHDRGRIVLDQTFTPLFMAGKFSGPPDPVGNTCALLVAAG